MFAILKDEVEEVMKMQYFMDYVRIFWLTSPFADSLYTHLTRLSVCPFILLVYCVDARCGLWPCQELNNETPILLHCLLVHLSILFHLGLFLYFTQASHKSSYII